MKGWNPTGSLPGGRRMRVFRDALGVVMAAVIVTSMASCGEEASGPTGIPSSSEKTSAAPTPTNLQTAAPVPTAIVSHTATPAPTATVSSTATPAPTATAAPMPTPNPTERPVAAATPTQTPLAEISASELYERVSPGVAHIVTPAGKGGGVLIEDGYLVTNYRVVWPYETVLVVFPDGTEVEDVPVLGWDPMADLAVLGPVDVSVQPLEFVDREDIPIGSELFLIGYPAEVDPDPRPTITGGILSRIREWERLGMTYLQTDAATTYSQSGGALINSKGQIIGISGLYVSDGNLTLVASAADIAPIVRKLVQGEFTSGLGDRKLPDPGGSFEFDVELLNPWESRGFVFEATEGTTLELELDGRGDGMFRVSTPIEFILAVDDGDTGVERGTVKLDASGVHFIEVDKATFDSSEFRLVSSARLRPLNDPDDGRTIRIGETVAGSVDHLGEFDWYSIILEKGDNIEIIADSLNIDTWLLIHPPGPSDNQVVSDNDSGGGLSGTNSEIVYRALHSGEHFIIIADAARSSVGGYYLSVGPTPEDGALARP